MKTKFTTNIDKELLQKIKIKAIQENKNVNEIIEKQLRKYLEEEVEMIRIPSVKGEWNIIIDEVEYNFYYQELPAMEGLFLNGYDSQDEEYEIGDKTITGFKEEYPHNKQGYRYILEIR